jgi:hypothetical protein
MYTSDHDSEVNLTNLNPIEVRCLKNYYTIAIMSLEWSNIVWINEAAPLGRALSTCSV